jgi:hypothetical protein
MAAGQQIGNAVPVEMGAALIMSVKKALLCSTKTGANKKQNRGPACPKI